MTFDFLKFFKKKERLEEEEVNDEVPQDEIFVSAPLKPISPQGTRFDPKVVIGICTLVVMMITYVISVGLDQPTESKNAEENAEDKFRNKQTTLAGKNLPDEINSLPDDYTSTNKKDKTNKKTNPQKAQEPIMHNQQQIPMQITSRSNYPNTNILPFNPSLQNASRQMSEDEKNRISALKSSTKFNISFSKDENNNEKSIMTNPQGQISTSATQMSGQESFIEKNSHNTSFYVKSILQNPLSAYEVKAGTIIPGILITGIVSDNPGQVIGQVRENIYDSITGDYLLIPSTSRLIGTYDSNVSAGQDRVVVVWNRVVFPNGSSIDLEGMIGADLDGYSGFHEKTNNHIPRLMNGVLIGSILTAGARIATGGVSDNSSFSQLAGQGIAENIIQSTTKITEKNLNISPTIEISPGYLFNIIVNKDIILKPYEG